MGPVSPPLQWYRRAFNKIEEQAWDLYFSLSPEVEEQLIYSDEEDESVREGSDRTRTESTVHVASMEANVKEDVEEMRRRMTALEKKLDEANAGHQAQLQATQAAQAQAAAAMAAAQAVQGRGPSVDNGPGRTGLPLPGGAPAPYGPPAQAVLPADPYGGWAPQGGPPFVAAAVGPQPGYAMQRQAFPRMDGLPPGSRVDRRAYIPLDRQCYVCGQRGCESWRHRQPAPQAYGNNDRGNGRTFNYPQGYGPNQKSMKKKNKWKGNGGHGQGKGKKNRNGRGKGMKDE